MVSHVTSHAATSSACQPNVVRLMLLVSTSSSIIGLASLWLRKKQYDLGVSQVALAYAQAAAECTDDKSWDDKASLINVFASRLREIPKERLVSSAGNFRSNFLAFASRKIGQFLFARPTVAIDCLSNFGDQVKRLLLGFHMATVGIVKADNKPFTRKAIFWIFGRHKGSSLVDGLDNSTMDEAGGSGNAATSRVEVMQGQCGEKGFVDLGVPLDQRMAEAEMLAPNNSQNKENSNHSHLFYGVDCVQMDWTLDGTSVLRVSGDFGQKYTTGFWVHMAGEPGIYARFSFLGSVKGQMLFSAVQWRLETDQQLSPPSPLLKLRGPFLKGSPDDF